MKKLLLALVLLTASLTANAWFALPQLPVLTPTGYAVITSAATTANVALGTNGASTPQATTAVVTNTGTAVAYVKLGAAGVTVTATTGYPVLPGQAVALPIGSSVNIAVIAPTGTPLISIVTGY